MALIASCNSSLFAPVSLLSRNNKPNHALMKVSVSPRKNGYRSQVVRSFLLDPLFITKEREKEVRRSDFPADFMFGASSSAIQTEGTIHGGRGPSTWDNMPAADTGIDSYHKFKDDVKMLKLMSADVYRFSISWSRILPTGSESGGVNQEGIDFYNDLINELIDHGITPFVTMLHYDLPQGVQDSYNGFQSKLIVDDFKAFANICFKNFGDRVKYWSTFNEPQAISQYFYTQDPLTMPYITTHNILLAHAATVKLYRDEYQPSQKGEIGLPLMAQGYIPRTDSPQDIDAAKRAFDFFVGWFLEPLVTGAYPFSMRVLVGDRLPKFTEEEKELVKGAIDFITINYYTSRFAEEGVPEGAVGFAADQLVNPTVEDANGVPIGPLPRGDTYAYTVPKELKNVLLQLKNQYQNPKIYISENGIMEPKEDIPLDKALNDPHRIQYLKDHLQSVKAAMKEGATVKGYCMWSLLDSVELYAGNTVRMGLNFTDYENDYKRIPKESAKWFKKFVEKKL